MGGRGVRIDTRRAWAAGRVLVHSDHIASCKTRGFVLPEVVSESAGGDPNQAVGTNDGADQPRRWIAWWTVKSIDTVDGCRGVPWEHEVHDVPSGCLIAICGELHWHLQIAVCDELHGYRVSRGHPGAREEANVTDFHPPHADIRVRRLLHGPVLAPVHCGRGALVRTRDDKSRREILHSRRCCSWLGRL